MAIEWAPDFSTFIDREKYGNAVWFPGSPASNESPAIPAGFYRPLSSRESESGAPADIGQITSIPNRFGTMKEHGLIQPFTVWGSDSSTNKPNYRDLKAAGQWNLADQSSPTWNYLSSLVGGQDVRNDPNALFRAMDLTQFYTGGGGAETGEADRWRPVYEQQLREALQGVDPAFVDRFVPAAGQATYNYWQSIDDSTTFRDVASGFGEILSIPPFRAAALAMGINNVAGTPDLAAMGEPLGGFTTDPSLADLGGVIDSATGLPAGGLTGLEGLTPVDLGQAVQPFTTNPSLADIGGVIDPATGFPVGADALANLGSLPNVTVPQQGQIPTVDLTAPASAGGTVPTAPLMPPAVPEVDPTFGGALTQTGAGQFENLGNTAAFGGGLGTGAAIGALPAVAAGGAATGGGTAPTGGSSPTGTAGGSGALGRILDGSATAQDWASLLGTAAPTLLSMFGLNQQQDAMNAIAQQQMAAEQARYQDLVTREQARYEDVVGRENTRLNDLISRDRERFGTLLGREDEAIARQRGDIEFGRSVGAPYRDRLAGLYADPSSFLSSPDVMAPVQQATDALARALSVKGNPAGNPAAMSEIQNYAANQLFGRLGEEKNRLGTLGGFSAFNQAGATVPGIGTNLSGSVPTPGQLFSGSPSAGSNVGTSGGLSALMGGAQAGAQQWGDLGRGLRNLMSLV